MSEKKSWRDVYKVHPAADAFPMLPEEELRKLGEDIKKNGLREEIALWRSGKWEYGNHSHAGFVVLDGRNRLDAMELVGIPTICERNGEYKLIEVCGRYTELDQEGHPQTDPHAFIISRNIRRRHLTKEQQADLIIKVMKAKDDFATTARSFSPENGKRGGSTKDTFKEKVVEEAKKYSISKRTVEKSFAKDRGPTKKHAETILPRKESKPATVQPEKAHFPVGKHGLENEILSLRKKIVDLQRELILVKGQLAAKQAEDTFNSLFGRIRGTDLVTLRRALAKKYHPDLNSNKTFTASEVMADINPLLKGAE